MTETEEQLKTALARLSNEVLGSLPLMEPLARREFGNSNYAILIQRAEEARNLLARMEPKMHPDGRPEWTGEQLQGPHPYPDER